MSDVFISGIAMTSLGRTPDKSVKDLTGEVVRAALEDAGLELKDLNGAWFSNTRQALMEGQNSIRGQVALRPAGVEGIPIINVENACASSSTGLHGAIQAIRAGAMDTAIIVGAEKMFYPDKPKEVLFRAFMGGTDIEEVDHSRAVFAEMSAAHSVDAADSESGSHTFFMDMYASMAKHHMATFGTTKEQIAHAAAKNHDHSQFNPLSQYQKPMSVEEVVNDVEITWPLTRSMCAPISDGAAAMIVSNVAGLKKSNQSSPIKIRACQMGSGTNRAIDDYDNHVGVLTAGRAYEEAGLSPSDVDVAEVHDATAFGEIVQVENLGFAKRGEGGLVTASGDTTLGGRIPVNTSGGLVSKGHPIAATGIIQLHELVHQLRGTAGQRQVEGARIAIAENGGGHINVEEAATVITVLERQ